MGDRIYVIYTRTNRRVQWKYAEYCGRWESVSRAIEKAAELMGAGVSFEYRVENRATDEITTGLYNAE